MSRSKNRGFIIPFKNNKQCITFYVSIKLALLQRLAGDFCQSSASGGQLGAAIEFFSFFFFSQIPTLGTRKLFKSDKISSSVFNKTAVWGPLVVTARKTSKYTKTNHFLTSFAMLALFPSFFSETSKGHGVFITFFAKSINQLNMTWHQ